MSQAEFGALVPCDKSVVSRIEAGLVQADEAFARAADAAFPHLDGFFLRFWKDCQTWIAAFTIQLIPREEAHVGLTGAFSMAETADAFVAHLGAHSRRFDDRQPGYRGSGEHTVSAFS
jgi:hypothetical protein